MRKAVKALVMWSLLLCMSMIFTACQQQTTWQEQYDLGRQYLSESNYEEAIAAFTAAIKIDPKQAPAYVGRGDAYVGLTDSTDDEKLEEALADYERAVELDENCEEGYLGMAEVYTRQGKLEKVLEILRKGWEITKSWLLGDRLSELEKEKDTELLDPEFGEREGYQAFNTLTEAEQNLIHQVLELLQNDDYTAIESLVANAGITMDLFTMVDGYKVEIALGRGLSYERADEMVVTTLPESEEPAYAVNSPDGLGIIVQARPMSGEGYLCVYYQQLQYSEDGYSWSETVSVNVKGLCENWQFNGSIADEARIYTHSPVMEAENRWVDDTVVITTYGVAQNNMLEWQNGHAEYTLNGETIPYMRDDRIYRRNGDMLEETITSTESYDGQVFTHTETFSSPIAVLQTW